MFDRFVTELKALDLSRMGMDGLRDTAAGVKRVRAALDALEARLLAKAADRTFDPAAGIELMRSAGGCSQREARRRNSRAQTLDKMPAVADALAGGDITAEHADALVRAAEATSAETVDTDGGLLEKTKARPPIWPPARWRTGPAATKRQRTAKPSSAASGLCAATAPGTTPTAWSTFALGWIPSPAPRLEPSSTTSPTVCTKPMAAETPNRIRSALGTSATPTPSPPPSASTPSPAPTCTPPPSCRAPTPAAGQVRQAGGWHGGQRRRRPQRRPPP